MITFSLILGFGITYAGIILLGSMSGIVSERSGIVNIGINGMMIIGACAYAVADNILGKGSSNKYLCYLIAMLASALFASFHSIATIKFKANQIISGTAINMLAAGIALMIVKIYSGTNKITINNGDTMFSNDKATIPGAFGINFIIAIISIIVLWFLLNKTQWGLRLRACGENPSAADSLGINVFTKQYQAVFISGLFAGLGGAFFAQKIHVFTGNVNGVGFLSLAVMILGQWRTHWASIGGILFGILTGYALYAAQNPSVMGGIEHISQIIKGLPFVLTIFTMVILNKKSRAPAAEGIPYDKTVR